MEIENLGMFASDTRLSISTISKLITSHFSCGAGLGMALWILESYVVLLDVTDVHNVKGCTVTPPYLDEYGETDPGLR